MSNRKFTIQHSGNPADAKIEVDGEPMLGVVKLYTETTAEGSEVLAVYQSPVIDLDLIATLTAKLHWLEGDEVGAKHMLELAQAAFGRSDEETVQSCENLITGFLKLSGEL